MMKAFRMLQKYSSEQWRNSNTNMPTPPEAECFMCEMRHGKQKPLALIFDKLHHTDIIDLIMYRHKRATIFIDNSLRNTRHPWEWNFSRSKYNWVRGVRHVAWAEVRGGEG
ncbi:hypothetical protein Zmor_025476 [Zophobas morio]|uniref:Uncharacterized protein n=1 Tax=Zophobas morio TaxID=2755281 RepID=A0AA38HRQ6_9CUCU|nr:hypothetical protein Zmor_025476 [Zophobas morio]